MIKNIIIFVLILVSGYLGYKCFCLERSSSELKIVNATKYGTLKEPVAKKTGGSGYDTVKNRANIFTDYLDVHKQKKVKTVYEIIPCKTAKTYATEYKQWMSGRFGVNTHLEPAFFTINKARVPWLLEADVTDFVIMFGLYQGKEGEPEVYDYNAVMLMPISRANGQIINSKIYETFPIGNSLYDFEGTVFNNYFNCAP
jgi:hypothetical protein